MLLKTDVLERASNEDLEKLLDYHDVTNKDKARIQRILAKRLKESP